MTATDVRLLGRFAVLTGDGPVPISAFGGRKTRQLLQVLAVHHDRHVSHDVLAEALWPRALPADPAANLGVLVNRARRALGDPAVIATGSRGYALTGCRVDSSRFCDTVAAARTCAADGAWRPALTAYRQALDLWAGAPLAEEEDAPWAQEFRGNLLGLHQAALEEAADAATRLGEGTLAVQYAEPAARAAPLREVASVRLARALDACGDQAAALATLHALRHRLAEELGVDPSPEVRQLLTDLLARPGTHRPGTHRPATPPTRPVTRTGPQRWPMLGRTTQLVAACAALDAAGGIVEIAAPPGAGKSRLLAELTARLPRPAIAARAYLPERTEPWSLARDLLREAAALDVALVSAVPRRALSALIDVVPDLADIVGDLPAVPIDPASRRALVLEGAVRLLAAVAGTGAVLVIDDLQWADTDSLTLLTRLLERAPDLRCALAHRSGEVPAGSAVRAALTSIATGRTVTTLELPPLDADDLTPAVGAGLAAALVAVTDGSPYAITEVILGLVRQDALTQVAPGRWQPAPVHEPHDLYARVQRLGHEGRLRRLRSQLDRHPLPEQEVLGLLALLARQAPAPLLADATGAGVGDVLRCLTGLAADDLARLGEQGWATSHDLVRETVEASLEPAERGRLHAILVTALSRGTADDAAGGSNARDAAELARHHAGAGDGETAARCYAQAARVRVDAGETGAGDLRELLDTGLHLATRTATQLDLLDLRAQVRARAGDLDGARDDLRTALARAGTGSGTVRSRLRARLAVLTSGAKDLQRAATLAEMAIVDAGADDAARAHALEVAAIIDMNLELSERSRTRSEEALALYRRTGDAAGAARILDARAMATFLDGRITTALNLFAQVSDLFTDSGDLLRVVTPLSTLGHGLVFAAAPTTGLERTESALDLARSLGHPEGVTYALWHRAEACAALGRVDDAVAGAREALAVAEQLGHRGWTATSWRALGIALASGGDAAGAQEAFTRSLETATGLTLFSSWAASRLALTLIHSGRVDAAEPLVRRALEEGPPLAGFEARLARAELARARRAADAGALAADAARLARAAGHLADLARLDELTASG